jgi:hypothetical protein
MRKMAMQMSVLSNPMHERFAQFLAQGKTATEAANDKSGTVQYKHGLAKVTQINAKP